MAAVRLGAAREQAQPGSLLLVVHDFAARSADELSLTKGDRIELIERDDDFGDGWFLGRHLGNGDTGLFPEVYTTPAPKGTLPQYSSHRRPVDIRPAPPVGNANAIPPATQQQQQQRPSSSGNVPPPATSSFAQASLRSSLPTTSAIPPRVPALNADSPVMHETLTVINEHITDLNGSRTVMGNDDPRTSRSSVYSSQLMNRFSYIPGHETDEDEGNLHTEDEVMGWSPDQVAEYLEDQGVEKLHCDVFKEQEISGEVLLAMDQSSLFIKEFQLGPVGRRLKTWHKIKALQDEVKRVAPPIEPVRSASQYSDSPSEPMADGVRHRSSTIGTILPRALDTPGGRHNTDFSNASPHRASSASASRPSGAGFPSRPEHAHRPSAHSIRTMNSRRHSSIDSSVDNIGRSSHRKQPSIDSSWQPGQMSRPGHRYAPSAEQIAEPSLRDSLHIDTSSPADVDKGYFSSTEMETRARTKRTGILHKSPPIDGSPSSVPSSQISSVQHTPVSAARGDTTSTSTSSTSANHWSSAVHNFGNKIGQFRSVTTPLSKPAVTMTDHSSPTVTKLEPTKTSDSAEAGTTTSPASLGFFGSQKARIMGLRTTSDVITKDEKAGLGSLADRVPGTVQEDVSMVSSPTRTGSTTPSTETRSFDLAKSDIHSRASTGSGGKLAPPSLNTRRSRHKTKKATSAYTKGLELKAPVEAMANCDYSGWMKKKSGSLMTTWKTRLFILKGRRLSYYYRDDDTEEKGLIDISFHRVLPAHNETLTGVHAAMTGAGRSAPSPKDATTKTAAQRDLEERAPAVGEDEHMFIFKLIPPKVGLSKAVNFTKPTVHYFAVNSRQEGRLWMAALMKATIDRDDDAAVTTTYNQKTISLAKARARRERPPALREESAENPTPVLDISTTQDQGLGIDGLSTQKTVVSPTKSVDTSRGKTFLFEDETSSMTPSTTAPTEAENRLSSAFEPTPAERL